MKNVIRDISHTVFLMAILLNTHQGLASDFYNKKAQGWHFYNEEIEEPVDEPQNALPPIVQEVQPPKVQAETKESDDPEQIVTVEVLREMLPKYLDTAMNTQSEDDVKRYLYLQKLALDKATEFSEIAQRVTIGNPILDESARRPTGSFLANEMNVVAGNKRDALISELSEKIALWFFYDPTGSVSQKQASVVSAFAKKHGMLIVPIANKDIPLPGNLFPDYKTDTGQIANLNIKTLPAFYLVQPPNAFIPLGQGGFTLEELQERTMIASVRTGIISEEQFSQTQAFNNVNNLANVDLSDLTRNIIDNPNLLEAYVRNKTGNME